MSQTTFQHSSYAQTKKAPKKIWNIDRQNTNKRIKELLQMREELLKNVDSMHVKKLMPGNTKTGINCFTISLLPILDCPNCAHCMYECYDWIHDIWRTSVLNDRMNNSVIHLADPKRFWKEVTELVKENFVSELRINVGGDLSDGDFPEVSKMARACPQTDFLFFTKNYKGINEFLSKHRFPKNVKAIMSAWKDTPMENPHNLPTAHVLYCDGSTTAPEFGAYYCGGNCSKCHFYKEGCWNLKKGESVIFPAH